MTRSSKAFTSCCATTTPILRLPVCVVLTNIVFALALLAAGCSSSGDGTTAETVISTPTSTEAPTTTRATTVETSDPEPPVTTEPAAEWTPEELEIIEGFASFQYELVEVLVDPDRDLEKLQGLASGALAGSLTEFILSDRASKVMNRGSVELRPLEIRPISETAVELDSCLWGRVEELTDGEVTVAADPHPVVDSSRMVLESGTWRYDGQISSASAGEPCEL